VSRQLTNQAVVANFILPLPELSHVDDVSAHHFAIFPLKLNRTRGAATWQTELVDAPMKGQYQNVLQTLGYHKVQALNLLLLTGLFAATVIVSAQTFVSRDGIVLSKAPHLSARWGLGLLQVLQGLTTVLTSTVFNQSLETVQWALTSRTQGIRTNLLLAVAPSTGVWGLIDFLFAPTTCRPEKLWAFFRCILMPQKVIFWSNTLRTLISLVIAPAAGVVLFCVSSTSHFLTGRRADPVCSLPVDNDHV
jgi:hypothetical protein